MSHRSFAPLLAASFLGAISSPPARGLAHFDVLVQSAGGRLVTGAVDFDDDPPVTTLGVRVFDQSFDELFALDEPGFNSIGVSTGTLPPGADALPGNLDLSWDFLPMKVGAVTSNLLHWDHADVPANVVFGAPPTALYSLSLFGAGDERFAADGADRLVQGGVVDATAADGFIHQHRLFFLDDDHDDQNSTDAAEGVYLIALRLRMDGLDRSVPIYLMWGTPDLAHETLEAAATWVDERADQLAPNFAADFDGDLDVDGTDLLTWQRYVGTTTGALQIQGDANGDHAIDAADIAAWQAEFGLSVATYSGAHSSTPLSVAAPEPNSLSLALAIVFAVLGRSSRPCRP